MYFLLYRTEKEYTTTSLYHYCLGEKQKPCLVKQLFFLFSILFIYLFFNLVRGRGG